MDQWKVGQAVAHVCGGLVYGKLTIVEVGARKIKTNDKDEWSVNGRRYGSSRERYYNSSHITPWTEAHEKAWSHARLWTQARATWTAIERRKDEIPIDRLRALLEALTTCTARLESVKETKGGDP